MFVKGFKEQRRLPLQKEAWKANPNTVGVGEVTWEGVWEETPSLHLCVPSDTTAVGVDLWLPGQRRPVASTSVDLGADKPLPQPMGKL